MDIQTLIGTCGAVIIVIAWSVALYNTIKSKKQTSDIRFVVIYCFAGILLTIYSALLGDIIFFVLNALAALIAMIEAFLYFRYNRKEDSIDFNKM